MTVNTMKAAWAEADRIFPTDYNKDEEKSISAGYDIYVSTVSNAWISDLGNRLEVNFEDGTAINIWVEENIEHTQTLTADGVTKIDGLTLTDALTMVAKRGFVYMNGFAHTTDIKAIIDNAKAIHETSARYASEVPAHQYHLDHENDHFLLIFPDGQMIIATHYDGFDMPTYGTHDSKECTSVAFEAWLCGVMAEECADASEKRGTAAWLERYGMSKLILTVERARLSREFAEKYGA